MTINFTTPACLMAIKRHRFAKDANGKHTETDEQYAAVQEVNVAAYFVFENVDLQAFVTGIAMRGLRLAAQAEWRAEHEGDELHKWLKSMPTETHDGVEYHRVDVNVAELMAERKRAPKAAKVPTAHSVMADISKLSQDDALKALNALKESNPMFAAMLAQAFGK